MGKRSLDDARTFGRSIQPTHDLQAEAGSADGSSLFAILDTNEIEADAQPKKITLSGVANVVGPLLPAATIPAAGAVTQVQFNGGTYLEGDAGFTYNKTTDTVSVGALVPTGSTVPTNGVYLPAANSVAISTNGTGRLFVDASGRVGMGAAEGTYAASVTATGNNGFLVKTGTASAVQIYAGNTGGEAALGTLTSDPLNLITAGSSRIRITSDGKVGIGTSSPALKLHVEDSSSQVIRWARTGVGAGSLDVDLSGNAVINAHTTSTGIAFHLQASEKARIDSSGRLLVGTSTNTGGALFQVNDNRIRVATAKTPASATDTGSAGEICWDANYIYVCTATNTWKRTAIATW